MAFLKLYNNNPTDGGTDGNAVSEGGAGTNPVAVSLDGSISENTTVKLALRCDSGYQTRGNTTITAIGTTTGYWSFCATADGTFASTLTISDTIGATNKCFYVKASSSTTETPVIDTSVSIQVVAKVEVVE